MKVTEVTQLTFSPSYIIPYTRIGYNVGHPNARERHQRHLWQNHNIGSLFVPFETVEQKSPSPASPTYEKLQTSQQTNKWLTKP
jgi:hypothetical protein